MIIERNISPYIVFSEDSVLTALRKISDNKSRIVFLVTESGKLEGVLTDGDFRRWVVLQDAIDLNIPVSKVCNKDYVWVHDDESPEKIEACFSERIEAVPLLDRHGHITGIARRRGGGVQIGSEVIDEDSPVFVIAEIGNNHNGSIEVAKRLVDAAVAAGANCAKFQMRDLQSLYRNGGDPNDASADLGAQYTLDLLAKYQLSDRELFEVFDYCRDRGITPLCTPWDIESVEKLERYGIDAYKVASADLTNHDLLEAVASTGKPVVCSTGMSTESEVRNAIALLRRYGVPLVLLHCNSTYPAPFKDVNLAYMDRLRELGQCPVGYSGHERGIAVAIAAVARGAKVIEKHLTLDRSMEGNDHKVSLLPQEFLEMVRGIREVEDAIGTGTERRMTQGEMINREVLGKSLVARCDIQQGEIITEDMIDVRSPGQGLPPYRKRDLIGKQSPRTIKKGDFFFMSDLDESKKVVARRYRFNRPFGVPVRFHDVERMSGLSNFDLLEFHLSYKDLDVDIEEYIKAPIDVELVVHSPELFAGDHIMDLCSKDEGYRTRSIAELRRVIDITRKLKTFFPSTERPRVIINAGGFTFDKPMPVSDRESCYELIAKSLSELDLDGIEIIPQTMPPFPWHFGGQRYHNLFVDPDEIVAFCEKYGYRVCLDLSHSKLACNHYGWSFLEFLEKVGPYAAHLHIVDAEGVDGEGLQIGDGEIDFVMVGEVLGRVAPGVSFVPEIWQGHKNNGEGFWIALERLEEAFSRPEKACQRSC